MSIPERLYRLAKGKIGEIREMFDQDSDAELDPELLARVQRAQARKSARQELDDALDSDPTTGSAGNTTRPSARVSPNTSLRSPDEIRSGVPKTASASTVPNSAVSTSDPLESHYRVLGLESGADFATVQAVYEKLLSRCRPERFPAGSPESTEALDIQNRLEATYKVLREALDPTARRFEMLEI